MMMEKNQIDELRALRGQGMVSAVGEYTPDELWEALDEIERLRAAMEWISENGPDDAWELRQKAREALENHNAK